MATYYVDSNATGLNDGSSWTDAWTSIASVPTGTGGDIILVSNSHSESGTTNIMAAAPVSNPQQVISTNPSTGNYQAGATFVSGSFNLYKGIRYSGITFRCQTAAITLNVEGGICECYECTFEGDSAGASPFYSQGVVAKGSSYYYGHGRFINCTFDFTNDPHNVGFVTADKSFVFIQECTFVNAKSPFFRATTNFTNNHKKFEVRNCDLSSATSLVLGGQQRCDFLISNCKLASSVNYLNTAFTEPLAVLDIVDCDDGTISSRHGLTAREVYQGSLSTVYTEYRSGGANDGTNGYSWKMATNANAKEFTQAIESNLIVREAEAASQTIALYLASSSTLNNDDFWIEVESPSELVSPTAQGKFRTTKPDPLATPTALTSDTSTWTGTGVGTVQKIEVPISPTIAGTVTVRCYLAKPSTTVYVDPKLSGTGYQRVYNGVLVDDNEAIITTTSTAGTQIYPFRQFVSDKFGAVLHPLRSN